MEELTRRIFQGKDIPSFHVKLSKPTAGKCLQATRGKEKTGIWSVNTGSRTRHIYAPGIDDGKRHGTGSDCVLQTTFTPSSQKTERGPLNGDGLVEMRSFIQTAKSSDPVCPQNSEEHTEEF